MRTVARQSNRVFLSLDFSLICASGCLHFAWANVLCLCIGVVSVQRLLRQHCAGNYWPEAVGAAAVGRGCTGSLLPVLSRTLYRQQDGMVEGLQFHPRYGQAGLCGMVGWVRWLCRHARSASAVRTEYRSIPTDGRRGSVLFRHGDCVGNEAQSQSRGLAGQVRYLLFVGSGFDLSVQWASVRWYLPLRRTDRCYGVYHHPAGHPNRHGVQLE